MESRYTWKNQLLLGLRNFALTAAVILLLTYLVVSSGQAARKQLQQMFVEEKEQVTLIDEPVAYGYENGAKIWEVRSEYAETEQQTESSELTRIYELILFKGGEENIHIRGDRGSWDKPREKLTLTGNVHVESADGTTFMTTEKLIWGERTKTLECPEFVDFRVEDNHVIANSLFSDDDLATIDFIGDVEMFAIGLEGENFITREGGFPIESIEGENKGEGMNVLAQYVHYDKGDRLCRCMPGIPVDIRNRHNLDDQGRPLPPRPEYSANLMEDPYADPAMAEALQRSVAQMDLSPDERAFLNGEIDVFELLSRTGASTGFSPVPDTVNRIHDLTGGELNPEDMGQAGTGLAEPPPSGFGMPGGRTPPMGGPAGDLSAGNTDLPGGTGTGIPGPVAMPPAADVELPAIPVSDPSAVLSAPNYSRITDWEISPDLRAELFEGDPDFSPYGEKRPGLVFCYRNDTKIWCEELHIDLNERRVDALRKADGRFRNLRNENKEPAEGRAARAVQESPTQLIGNYLTHYWKDNVTIGFGRVLSIQPEKDVEADNVVYYEDSDVVHAWGGVIVHQYSGRWWEESGAAEDIHEERAREDVKNPTVVSADAILTYNQRVSWAFGNVAFKQEKQTITGDRAQYEDDTQILIVADNVDYTNRDGEQLACALLTMDLYLEEYVAEGAAIARNIVPEEYRDNLSEFKSDEDRQPEDDARARLLEHRTAAGLGDWSEAIENPPPPPPIEVLGSSEEYLPKLGPEVPAQSEGEQTTSEGDVPVMTEANTGSQEAVEQSAGSTEDAVVGVEETGESTGGD